MATSDHLLNKTFLFIIYALLTFHESDYSPKDLEAARLPEQRTKLESHVHKSHVLNLTH